MLDFSNLHDILLPPVKKVKLQLFNSFEEDTMTTLIKKQEEKFIPYYSLRQKYGITQPGNSYPLPQKYSTLIDLLKNLEMSYWRNQSQIQLTVEKNLCEIVLLSRLLTLNPQLYLIKVIKDGVVIQHPFYKKVKIIEYSGTTPFPRELQIRIDDIQEQLNKIVQNKHQEFLKSKNQEDFESFGTKFQIYHNDFDINDCPNIVPMKFKKQIIPTEIVKNHNLIMTQIYEHYDKRGVSFMFQENLLLHLSVTLNKSKNEIEKILQNLYKLFPEKIKLINNHINQSRWMIQIDRTSFSDLCI